MKRTCLTGLVWKTGLASRRETPAGRSISITRLYEVIGHHLPFRYFNEQRHLAWAGCPLAT